MNDRVTGEQVLRLITNSRVYLVLENKLAIAVNALEETKCGCWSSFTCRRCQALIKIKA